MKKILTILCLLVLIPTLAGCGSSEAELTNLATYEDYTLQLDFAEFVANAEGNNYIKVNATYTNNSSEPQYALSCFAVKAFQNNVEITDVSDINGDQNSLIQEVKDGASLSVTYLFELTDESDIEVLVGEPTAEQKTIAKETFLYNTPVVEENPNSSILGTWELDFVDSWQYAVDTGVKEDGFVESQKKYFASSSLDEYKLDLTFNDDGNMNMVLKSNGGSDINWGTYSYSVDGDIITIVGFYPTDSVCEIDNDNNRLICDSFIEDDDIKNLYYKAD